MKRQHPLFSSLGLFFTAILLAVLGLMVWRSGGMAFSPGPLSAKKAPGIVIKGFASHTEFESQCSLCHAPLETTQDILCEDCHVEVKDQIDLQSGAHGKIADVNRCAVCHSDHRGKEFDPTKSAMADFDHTMTSFSLEWHQVNYETALMDCEACHVVIGEFKPDEMKCQDCHDVHDHVFMLQHIQAYGENCLDCHDGKDTLARFDHATASFHLDGKHAGLKCEACHGLQAAQVKQAGIQFASSRPINPKLTAAAFKDTPSQCSGCHGEPQTHSGMFSSNCAECHTTTAWTPAKWDGKPFDHDTLTSFSLALHRRNFEGEAITCRDCHGEDVKQVDLQTCFVCHSTGGDRLQFMSGHLDQFGPACLDCHDGVDRLSNFEHANFFPLEGVHAKIECDTCHKDKVFRGTPAECVQCHAEPAIHAGFFGLQCGNCHTAQAWSPAELRVHSFPLDHGGQGEMSCTVCHVGAYVEYTCYGCHDHKPDEIRLSHIKANVSLEELPNCVKCHPNGLRDEIH
jgi:hypothetical protein